MSGPPKGVDADELVLKLMGPAPSETFAFRKYRDGGDYEDIPIRIQLLTNEESMQAIVKAQEEAKRRGETPKEYGDVYREAQAIEIVRRCLRHIDISERADGTQYYKPLMLSSQQARDAFTEPELAYLLNCYELVKAKFGVLEDADETDVEMWISRLSDGMQGIHFLAQLDSQQCPVLLLRVAQWARELCRAREYPLPDWRGGSASTSESSESGTTSSGGPPVALTESGSGVKVPHEEVMTRKEARAAARKMNARHGQRAKKKKTDDEPKKE